jgi:hypothetical protein
LAKDSILSKAVFIWVQTINPDHLQSALLEKNAPEMHRQLNSRLQEMGLLDL